MKLRISRDARPQATLLLTAAAVSIILWFIPFAELLTYPFRLFVTFIHEGGHALAALLTGNSVASLSIATTPAGKPTPRRAGSFPKSWSPVRVTGCYDLRGAVTCPDSPKRGRSSGLIGSAGLILLDTLFMDSLSRSFQA